MTTSPNPLIYDALLAHVKAVLRRAVPMTAPTEEEMVVVGDLRMVPGSYQVHIGDRSIELPPKEFELLLTLARNPGRVFSVDELMDQVWQHVDRETQTIYVHIRWLRQKIEEDPTHPQRLMTIRGAGYKLMALEE